MAEGPWPTARTRVAGVIGEPLRHSLSPLVHNAAFSECGLDWVFVALEVPRGQAKAAIAGARSMGMAGLSVTMPHKSDVARAVDRLSPEAERLGAVNTVVRRGDELWGESTDGGGFLDSLEHDGGVDPSGLRCVVLGAGGAGRAVVSALASAGASEVVVVNRSPERGAAAAALAGSAGRLGSASDVRGADVVVNATPVGMRGVAGPALPLDPGALGRGQMVVDLVYHPLRTPLLSAAADAGARTLGGVGMLVRQAARSFGLWTGREAPVEVMLACAERALAG